MTITDNVNHPSHYTSHPSGIEVIQITERQNFCLGNAVKYVARAGKKNDEIEDLDKAFWYLMREINSDRNGGIDYYGYNVSQKYLAGEPNSEIFDILDAIFEYSFHRKPRTTSPLIDAAINLKKYIEKRKLNT